MKQLGMKMLILIFTVVRISNHTGCYIYLFVFNNAGSNAIYCWIV